MLKFRLILICVLFSFKVDAWEHYNNIPEQKTEEIKKGYILAEGVDPGSFSRFDVINPEKMPDLYTLTVIVPKMPDLPIPSKKKKSPLSTIPSFVTEDDAKTLEYIKNIVKVMPDKEKELAFDKIKRNLEGKGYEYDPDHPEFLVGFLYYVDTKTNYIPPITLWTPQTYTTKISGNVYNSSVGNMTVSGSAKTVDWGNTTTIGGYNSDSYKMNFMILIFNLKDGPPTKIYSNIIQKWQFSPSLKDWAKTIVTESLKGWVPAKK